MENEKMLIDVAPLMKNGWHLVKTGKSNQFLASMSLADVPPIDAEPVKHGRWVHVPSSDMMTGKAYKCSECNKMRYGSFMPNYCQICGAKMDGERREGE